MAYQKLSDEELRTIAGYVAAAQFNQRAGGDGVFGVIDAKDMKWLRRNRVQMRKRADGSVRVDVIYSAEYQRELEAEAREWRRRNGTANI